MREELQKVMELIAPLDQWRELDRGLWAWVGDIKPETAALIVDRKDRNRRKRESRVRQYASDMTEGKWRLTGQPLIFSLDGCLVNGQHTLTACVEAWVPFPALVIAGVEEVAMPDMDCGIGRSLGDVFNLRGEEESNLLAAAAGHLHRYLGGLVASGVPTPSREQAIEIAMRHPRLRQSAVRIAQSVIKKHLPNPASFVFFHYLISESEYGNRAEVFFKGMEDGAGLPDASPILVTRDFLRTWKSKRGLTQKTLFALLFKSWNAWIAGNEMKVAKFRTGGEKPEAFPSLRGCRIRPTAIKLAKSEAALREVG